MANSKPQIVEIESFPGYRAVTGPYGTFRVDLATGAVARIQATHPARNCGRLAAIDTLTVDEPATLYRACALEYLDDITAITDSGVPLQPVG
jgi:hypothetical protein